MSVGVAASSVRSNSRKPRWLNSRPRPRPRLQSGSQKSIRHRRRRKLADPTPPLFAPADTTTTAALLERQSRIRHARNFGPRAAIPAPPRLWDIVGLPPSPILSLSLSLAHFPPFWCQKGREGTPGNVAGTQHTFSVRKKTFSSAIIALSQTFGAPQYRTLDSLRCSSSVGKKEQRKNRQFSLFFFFLLSFQLRRRHSISFSSPFPSRTPGPN